MNNYHSVKKCSSSVGKHRSRLAAHREGDEMMSVRSRVKLAVEQLCLDASLEGLSLTGFNPEKSATYGTNSVYDFYDQFPSTALNVEMSYSNSTFPVPREYGMSCFPAQLGT
eukprot:scaffold9862_cov149-Skeletonema_dohrnii-CCMP3373.AAC.2